jgi:hypothetical protein
MSLSKETLRAMINEFGLIELSDDELNTILPDVEAQLAVLAKIRALDLTKTPSARQICTVRELLSSRLEGTKNE